MNKGWIHLHRKLLDCILWNDSQPFDRRSAWIDLLLLANHSDKTILFDGEETVISRGQYLTSVRQLSERWRWSKDRTLKFLRTLVKYNMISKESNAKRTLITIVNYGVYQDTQDTNKDTDRYTNKDTDSYTDSPQTKNVKNVKNEKNEKNNNRAFTPPSIDEVRTYCQERNNNINPEAFIDYYAARGWELSKGRKVKDWKACVRTWEKNNFDKPKTNKFNNFQGRQYDALELERAFLGSGT